MTRNIPFKCINCNFEMEVNMTQEHLFPENTTLLNLIQENCEDYEGETNSSLVSEEQLEDADSLEELSIENGGTLEESKSVLTDKKLLGKQSVLEGIQNIKSIEKPSASSQELHDSDTLSEKEDSFSNNSIVQEVEENICLQHNKELELICIHCVK